MRRIGALLVLLLIVLAPAPLHAEDVTETVRLDIADDTAGLPVPRGASEVTRTSGPVLRELKAVVAADAATTLGFYRRELTRRGWKEDAGGVVDTATTARRSFAGAEGSAVLVLTRAGTVTVVSLVIHASEEVVAARQLEAREAERAVRGEALADQDSAANNLDHPGKRDRLRSRSDAAAPIPVPRNAEGVVVDSAAGRLTYTSAASVRELELFYRTALKPMGFVERPAAPHPGVAALEFAKADVPLVITFTRATAGVTVTATGDAVKTGIHLNDEARGK